MIICCGEGLVDLVPEPVPGGGPLNVAVAVARLGGPAAFVGRVSTDRLGDLIWEYLQENHVDLRAAQRGPEPTATARVEHVPELVFRFEGDDTADTQLRPVDLTRFGEGPHILHGGTLGLFRGRTAEVLASLAEQHTGTVSLDPNVRPQIVADRSEWQHFHDRWLARAHLYKASDADLDWIWPGRAPAAIADELLAAGRSVVAITHGADGAAIYTAGTEIRLPAAETSVVDTVGAGDTFAGSLLLSFWELGLVGDLTRGADLSRATLTTALSRAVAAAAITCSRAGADPPTQAELEAAWRPPDLDPDLSEERGA